LSETVQMMLLLRCRTQTKTSNKCNTNTSDKIYVCISCFTQTIWNYPKLNQKLTPLNCSRYTTTFGCITSNKNVN